MKKKYSLFIFVITLSVGVSIAYCFAGQDGVQRVDSKDDVQKILQQDNGYAVLEELVVYEDSDDMDAELKNLILRELIDGGSSGLLRTLSFRAAADKEAASRELYLQYLQVQLIEIYDALISMSLSLPRETDNHIRGKKLHIITQFVGEYSFEEANNDIEKHGLEHVSADLTDKLRMQKKALDFNVKIENNE